MTMHRDRTKTALLALALLAACDAKSAPEGSCALDGDCASGVCNTSTGQCLPSSHKAPGLEVWPPTQNNQGWVAQEFPEGTLKPNGEVQVQLAAGVSLEGQVYASDLDDKGGKKLIPARIVVWRDSKLPGRPPVQLETTVTPSQREGKNQGQTTYVLWLARGVYTAHVVPLEPFDALYPPVVVSGIKVEDHLKQDFVLDGKDRAVDVTGRVVDATGKPLVRDKAPVPVRVRAFRPGGLGYSTLGTADASGVFAFKVPAGVESYTVRVERSPDGEPVPTMECAGRVLGIMGADQKQAIGDVTLPPFRFAEPYAVKVVGVDDLPVAQATVTFTAALAVSAPNGYKECSASFTQSGITDSEGKVTLKLLPGDAKNRSYSVTVVSPASSPYASQWLASVEVGPQGGALQAFVLDRRYVLRGRVETTGERPVPGAIIEAGAIASGEALSALPPSKASATTDATGAYELHVDPGVYNIDIRPPVDLALPAFGLTAKSIQGNLDGVLFIVPEAKALRGRILDPTGHELPSAQVKVYDLVPELEKPLKHKAVLRGSSVTDPSGSFALLLPPSLAD